jgi:hypothetical protein
MDTGAVYPRPANVQGKFGSWVEADVFHISERIREVGENLRIQLLDPPQMVNGQERRFAIVELTAADGSHELVYRAPALDGRVIEHVEYLLQVPFNKRFAEAERLADKQNKEDEENRIDQMVEEFGHEFQGQLWRNGFIQSRGRSYPSRHIRPTKPSRLIVAGA